MENDSNRGRVRPTTVVALATILLVFAGQAYGGEIVAAKIQSVDGVLLQRHGKKVWKTAKAGSDVPAGSLVVALPRSELLSANGAVKLSLLADVGQRGKFPVLETAVLLHEESGQDLELTFDRGLILLTNAKKAGAATIDLRVREEQWILTLNEPGTSVGLELYSRHAPGLPKLVDEKLAPPHANLLMLVIKGQAFLDTGHKGLAMKAPPGLASMHWDSITGTTQFQELKELPEIAVKAVDDLKSKIFKNISRITQKIYEKDDIGAALDLMLAAEGKEHRGERLSGVTLAGAIDDLPRVLQGLADPDDEDVREHAVLVLRHWLGRGQSHPKALLMALLEGNKKKPAQAMTVVQLLFGFDEEGRRSPETYDLLIDYLRHSNIMVRQLSHWHLVRLAPAGKLIAYDAGWPDERRLTAIESWRQLIPAGQLPKGIALKDKLKEKLKDKLKELEN